MKKLFALAFLATLLSSCSDNTIETPVEEKLPINISVGVQTRANDSAFANGDAVGIYVVNYDGTTAGTLQTEGNQADNTMFTYNGDAWNSDETIYWKNKSTATDFYAYYPYSASVDIAAHHFEVKTDQSNEANFWASDFLWGKMTEVMPTPNAVSILTKHSLSRIIVEIKPGDGFTAAEWAAASKSVKICGVKTSATINLATGVATATGNASEIIPLSTSSNYVAMMVPQTVADDSKLVVVTVEGTEYVYRTGYTFKANTQHNLSIAVNKDASSVNVTIGEWEIDSDIQEGNATEEDKADEMTFDILVNDIETRRAAIKITPSDNTKTFCWTVMEWDGVAIAEEVMNDFVAMYGGWMNSGMMLYSGVQDYTGGPGSAYKYRLDAPDTDYLVIAFGYAGGITTEANMVTFHTLEAPGAEETTFQVSTSNVTPYGFTLGVTPSEASTYYIFDVIEPSEWNEVVAVEAINAGIAEILEMQQAYDPNVTLSQVLSMYYYRGAYNVTVSGMTPETTVMAYVCAIDHKTGTVAKTHVFNPLVTTTEVGSITPTIELVGNYSGKEENGTIFGDAAYTANSAIAVLKYTGIEGARSLFATMLGDNMLNMTDAEIFGYASGYWESVSTSQPYSFYLVEWDYEQTALAYAVDSNGLAGGAARLLNTATAENKDDIEELRALVNELNSASKSSFSMPTSIVVNEGIKLTALPMVVETNI